MRNGRVCDVTVSLGENEVRNGLLKALEDKVEQQIKGFVQQQRLCSVTVVVCVCDEHFVWYGSRKTAL